MFDSFCAECKKQMWSRKMTNAALARATGYKTSTINAFFSNIPGREKSPAVAKAIAAELGIKIIVKS